jgi:hypothetical protein
MSAPRHILPQAIASGTLPRAAKKIVPARSLSLLLFALLAVHPAARAQSLTPPPPASQSTSGPSAELLENDDYTPKRMFGMIPDFQSSSQIGAVEKPLTASQKFRIAAGDAFDISADVGNLFQASLQQATDGQPNYGEGWGPFGKRFAAAEADQVSGSFLIYGILPTVFHEDPRYFRRGRGSARSRVWYAFSRSVITRNDDGRAEFNKSQVFGQLIANGISTSYYPAQDRTANEVALNWAVDMGYCGAFNILSEFYPDLMNAVLHHHARSRPA